MAAWKKIKFNNFSLIFLLEMKGNSTLFVEYCEKTTALPPLIHIFPISNNFPVGRSFCPLSTNTELHIWLNISFGYRISKRPDIRWIPRYLLVPWSRLVCFPAVFELKLSYPIWITQYQEANEANYTHYFWFAHYRYSIVLYHYLFSSVFIFG